MIQDLLRLPYARSQFQEIHVLAERMAGEFGLDGALSARTLPAGPRRVLEIARAFVGKPKLLMLDEPSAGLNREEIQVLIASIQRLNKAGLSILLVSHDMELMAVAETVYVLNFGEILAKGSMAAIQQDVNVREVYLGV
jgi:ABC-type branched-subunit amino acid transport system ATPase component